MTTQKTLVVDLDDTICIPNHDEKDTYRKYGLAKPIPEMIEALKAARTMLQKMKPINRSVLK